MISGTSEQLQDCLDTFDNYPQLIDRKGSYDTVKAVYTEIAKSMRTKFEFDNGWLVKVDYSPEVSEGCWRLGLSVWFNKECVGIVQSIYIGPDKIKMTLGKVSCDPSDHYLDLEFVL